MTGKTLSEANVMRRGQFFLSLGLSMIAMVSMNTAGMSQSPSEADQGVPTVVKRQVYPQGVTVAELSNGLTIIVQENHTVQAATVRCYVKYTGSIYEAEHLGAGLSHVLEHVVAGGTTTKRTEKEIAAIIDRFGGKTNAYTTTNFTCYYIDCPARHVKEVIELLADAMQRVAFEPKEFERELKVVKQELADGEVSRSRVLWKLLNQTLYLVHPARHPVIGYLDVLNHTSNEAIIQFYRARYIPNNQVFVVVGDVQTDEVIQQIAEQYRGIPRAAETYIALGDEPPQVTPRRAVREMEGDATDIAIAWPTVKLTDPDLYPLDVLADILARGESSRLVRRLQREKPLALRVDAASATPEYVRGWFGILATCPPENYEEVRRIILEEVYRLRDELVPENELARAKKKKVSDWIFERESLQATAESLARSYLATGDPLFDKLYTERIQSVTSEQLREVARKYFVPDRLNEVVIAPLGRAPKTASEGLQSEESDIRLVRLPNGLRVLVKRQARLPIVTMQVAILGGNLLDTPETAGRTALLAGMLDKGTRNYTADQIAELFDDLDARVGFLPGRNTVVASLNILKENFAKAGDLVTECLLEPRFDEGEFAKVKKLVLDAIAQRSASPQAEAQELFADLLPADSPYHILTGGKRETVERLSLDDIKQYHRVLLNPANMVVAVFGDINPDEAVDMVEKWYGKLTPPADAPKITFDRNNAIPNVVTGHKQVQKPTAVLLMGYPGPSIRDEADYTAMMVLDTIMSGYDYPGGWLHEELRGAGLVYGVHAFQSTGPAPGYFVIMAQTRPDTLAEVVQRVLKNVEKAKQGEITDEEFERAKELLISYHAQQNITIAAQATQAALDELYGLGYDYDKKFDERVKAVTLEDVKRVARKYFGPFVLATVSPAPSFELPASQNR
ncbi:MAG: peptidase M16 [Thermogutta sp.]|nr:MAG: peptidase M16 [Thermogutta sp.]